MTQLRIATHYIVATLLLTIYGTQICPFLDTLSPFTLAAEIGGAMFIGITIRSLLVQRLIRSVQPAKRVRYQFIIELGMFLVTGLGLAISNMIFFGFPLGSGLKLTVGTLTLGLFAAIDMALARQRQIAREFAQQHQSSIFIHNIFPLTRKFTIICSSMAALGAGILILVINHDLLWIRELPKAESMGPATLAVIVEISFVIITLLLQTINMTLSYARNLKLYFDRQTKVLAEVTAGRLNGHVPVTTNDEFGVIGRDTNFMIKGLRERTEALQRTQDVTIRALASLAETRDNETGKHIVRTQHYMLVLARELASHSAFGDFLDPKTIDLLFKSAPLHDIGKVGVPDRILLKPGRLTAEEFNEMKKHTTYGRNTLRAAEKQLGDSSFLRFAREIAYSHHERWDGSGYPQGLKGEDIPLSGRLMALADVYDALISERIYKSAFSHQKAYSIIIDGKANHFDPDVVEAFVRCENDFREIARKNKG